MDENFQGNGGQTPDLPQSLDLGQLSPQMGRSEAIEALIQQNDDLMARLSVALRRISTLEESLGDNKDAYDKLKFHHDSLKDQLLVLKQKAQSLVDRKENHGLALKTLKDRIRTMEEKLRLEEMRFAEAIESHKKNEDQLLAKIATHARRLQRFLTYRKRVQDAAKSFRNKKSVTVHNLQQEIHSLKSGFEERMVEIAGEHDEKCSALVKEKMDIESKLLAGNRVLREELDKTSSQLEVAENTLSDLRLKMSESTQYIQDQSKENKIALEKLTSDFNRKIAKTYQENDKEKEELRKVHSENTSKLQAEIEKLQRDNQQLFDKCSDLEKVYEENVSLKNKIVFTERKRDEVKSKLHEEISLLQKNLGHYRSDANSKSSEIEEMRKTQAELTKEVTELKKSNIDLTNQVESTQTLWRDNQRQLEKEIEKNNSMQKLNQQLSRNLNQAKDEFKQMKGKMDSNNIELSRRIRELSRSDEVTKSITEIRKGQKGSDPEMHPALMNKLDSLIAEIQSGFTKK